MDTVDAVDVVDFVDVVDMVDGGWREGGTEGSLEDWGGVSFVFLRCQRVAHSFFPGTHDTIRAVCRAWRSEQPHRRISLVVGPK